MKTRLTILALATAMASGSALAAGGSDDSAAAELSGGKATSATTDPGASGPTAGGSINGDARPSPEAVTDFDRVSIERLDKDQDQQISREEASEHEQLAEQFDDLDRNRDEQIDEAEFAPFEEQQSDAAGAMERDAGDESAAAELSGGKATSATTDPGASGPTAGGSIQGDARPSPGAVTDFDRVDIERLDRDQDRQLTREEVSEHPQISERFDDLDANDDGVLEESEFAVLYEEPAAGAGERMEDGSYAAPGAAR